MDFREKYKELSKEQRERFCSVAGVSHDYIRLMLLPRKRVPNSATVGRLLAGCKALRMGITHEDLVRWFYVENA